MAKFNIKPEVKKLEDFDNQYKHMHSKYDNIRNLLANYIMEHLLHYSKSLKDVNGKPIPDFFYRDANFYHDFYSTNHQRLTYQRVHGMISDTIKAIKGNKKVAHLGEF